MYLLNIILICICLGIIISIFIYFEKQIVKNDLKDYINDESDEDKSNRNITIIAFIIIYGIIYYIIPSKFKLQDNYIFNAISIALGCTICISLFIILKYWNACDNKRKDLYDELKLKDIKVDYNNYNEKEELLEKIDYMSGQEFENILINKLLPVDGYEKIEGTKYTGDYGVDIIAYRNGLKCAIQCKRFKEKVSNKAIQEIVAGRKHYRCDKAIVITNNYYTKNAQVLAEDNNVELINRDDLIILIKNYLNNK